MSSMPIDLRARRMLLADWFARLGNEAGLQLHQFGASDNQFTLGAPTALNVTARFIEEPPLLQFVSSDTAQQELIDRLAQQALARTEAGDLGGTNWYSVSLDAPGLQLAAPFSIGSMVQQLGTQTRISGWRRLGPNILVEFAEELPAGWDEKNALLAPKGIAHVHVATPGPCAGFLSSHVCCRSRRNRGCDLYIRARSRSCTANGRMGE